MTNIYGTFESVILFKEEKKAWAWIRKKSTTTDKSNNTDSSKDDIVEVWNGYDRYVKQVSWM